jgi:MoaA/NifB/PqqE/SkfB family radical SAM enzyme
MRGAKRAWSNGLERIEVANLSISTRCNQRCPYCFATDHHGAPGESRDFLDLDDLERRLDFLKRSGIDQVRLMGGEPTLHPQFTTIVERSYEAGFKIVVFSNGRMPESALSCLASLPAADCTVLVNVNEPALSTPDAHLERCAAIRRLGQRALLGLNIYRPGTQLDFLLPIIADADCLPLIRLGMAHPCLSGDNQYIHPSLYTGIGAKVVRFAQTAFERGIQIEFDCGFVRCMFSDQGLEILRACKADVGWRCNPILDIDTTGRVIYCYPLANLGSVPLTSETDAAALRQLFESRTRPYRRAGVFRECSTCPFKASGECPGGCLAVTVRRFRHTAFRLPIPRQEAAA